jgi:hypothetical protein
MKNIIIIGGHMHLMHMLEHEIMKRHAIDVILVHSSQVGIPASNEVFEPEPLVFTANKALELPTLRDQYFEPKPKPTYVKNQLSYKNRRKK